MPGVSRWFKLLSICLWVGLVALGCYARLGEEAERSSPLEEGSSALSGATGAERKYLDAPKAAIEEQIAANDADAGTGINLSHSLVFWSESERLPFYRDSLRLTPRSIQEAEKLGSFPSRAWKELDRGSRESVARAQTRGKYVSVAGDFEMRLPETARAVLNRYPVDLSIVEPVRLGDATLYPQCFSAVLWFHGLQPRPRIYLPEEVLSGKRNIREVLAEFFEAHGFRRIEGVRGTADLRFGDVLLFPPHAQVYLAGNLVFEKPNGSPYSSWRIMEDDVSRTIHNDRALVILRKN